MADRSTARMIPTAAWQQRSRSGIVLIGLGVVLFLVASAWLYWESRRFEPVVVAVRDVAAGQQLTAQDLGIVDMPRDRPDAVRGFSDPSAVIGNYAEVTILANTVIVPRMVRANPPTEITYPNGRALPPNMVGVPIDVSSLGPITDRDALNIGFISDQPSYCERAMASSINPDAPPPVVSALPPVAPALPPVAPAEGQPSPESGWMPVVQQGSVEPPRYACRWASSLSILYIDPDRTLAYVAMTPAQSLAYQALRATGAEVWFERYSLASQPLQYLDRRYLQQVSLSELTDPVETTLRPEPRRPAPIIPSRPQE